MKKTSFLLATVALIFLASVCTLSFAALIQREESKRDPTTGFDPAPGESMSFAYQYGEYDPITQKYYNIYSYHDYDWEEDTGDYDPHTSRSTNQDHPWIETFVICQVGGLPPFCDTYVKIQW
jgi:hypothetical protein